MRASSDLSRAVTEPCGLLLLDKPAGITSHDAVARARRWLHTRRVGHAGTLDPMATGLLTLCIGPATRMAEYLTGLDKRYVAGIRLGVFTNTDDAEGETTATHDVPPISDIQLQQIELRFTGEIWQMPPQFSAIKKGGVRSYARARQGEEFELEPRRVVIHELKLARDEADRTRLQAEVHCGSGTYIRALARDIGALLGCGAHLDSLRRVSVGTMSVSDALTESECAALAEQGGLEAQLRPMDAALMHAPQIRLGAAEARAVLQGQMLRIDAAADVAVCRIYGPDGRFLAVGQVAGGRLRPVKVLSTEQDAAAANSR